MEEEVSADYILSWYKSVEDDPSVLGRAMEQAIGVFNFIRKDNPLPLAPEAEEEVLELAA